MIFETVGGGGVGFLQTRSSNMKENGPIDKKFS